MATGSNSREVELKLRVATLGAEGIAALEQDIRNLAAEGKVAAEAGNQLADEIARLGAEASKLQSFKELAVEVENLAQSSERTRVISHGLADDLARQSEATAEFANVERLARQQLEETRLALQAKRDEQVKAKNDEERASRTSEEHTAILRKLRLEINGLEAQEREHARSLQTASEWAKEAATQEGVMARALQAATKEADSNAAALAERNAEMIAAEEELRSMGVATDNLAASEIKLANALGTSQVAREELIKEQIRHEAQLVAEREEEERLATQAKVNAASYQNFWHEALRQREADEHAAAAAAAESAQQQKQAAQQLKDAFGTVGTKSVAELRDEIERVRAAMTTLQGTAGLTGPELDRAMALGGSRIKELERDIRAATGQLTLMDRVSAGLKSTVGQLAASFGAYEIGTRLAQGFVSANLQMEKLRLGLGTIYKSVDITSKQIDFLNSVAGRAGVSVGSISESFVKFSASMQAANIPLQDSNALFAAITQSAGTLGLSGDKVAHMLDALAQMASKGTVSMEELRQQLGDSLPGALSLTAKGLGISEAQLIKLVESGQLAARDLFPALTKSLQSMGGEVNTLGSSWERFKNALTVSAQQAGDSGWMDAMKAGMAALGIVVASVVIPLQGFFEVVFGIAKAAGVLVGSLLTMSNPMEALGKIASDAGDRLQKMIDGFDQMIGLGDGAAKSSTNAGKAAEAAGKAHEQGAGGVVKMQAAYAEMEKTLGTTIEVTEKHAKATEKAGQAAVQLAQLAGDEAAKLTIAAQAAEANAAAGEKVAAAKQALVDVLIKEREQIVATSLANGEDSKARQEQLKALDEKIVKSQAAAEQARAEADANNVGAAVNRVAAEAVKDHALQVDKLREAMVISQQITRETQLLEVNGKRTKEDVTRATIAQAEAEALYRDALKDATALAQSQVAALEMQARVAASVLEVKLAEQKAAEKTALLLGNETAARIAVVKQREIEIQLAKLNVQAMRAEADAMDVALNKRVEELILSGKWTDQLAAEIQLRRQEADLKRQQAAASEAGISVMERELQKLKEGIFTRNDHRAASDNVVAGIGAETKARGENVKAMDAETEKMFALNKAKLEEQYNRNKVGNDRITSDDPNKTADNFAKNKDGSAAGTFTNLLQTDMAVRLRDTQGKGMSPDEINQAIEQAKNLQDYAVKNPSGNSPEFYHSVVSIANAATAAKQKRDAAGAPGNQPAPEINRTVTVNIGGTNHTIGVDSQSSSDALVGMLRSLESAAGSAA